MFLNLIKRAKTAIALALLIKTYLQGALTHKKLRADHIPVIKGMKHL